jgi:hypothetical protein
MLRHCCHSWNAENASPNRVLRNGGKRRPYPRELARVEACQRLRPPEPNMRLDGNKFQRCQALPYSKEPTTQSCVAAAQPCSCILQATYGSLPRPTGQKCLPLSDEASILLVATVVSAHAVDEIQVYNAEIAKVGQWTMQMHLNYVIGRKEPDFPGGLIPHRALNGTPEWAYGITDWWEMGSTRPLRSTRTEHPIPTPSKSRAVHPRIVSAPVAGRSQTRELPLCVANVARNLTHPCRLQAVPSHSRSASFTTLRRRAGERRLAGTRPDLVG